MTEIQVTLMKDPVVYYRDQKVNFPYRKSEALFYYLCIKNQITREEAVSILWADSGEKVARKNLRDAIYNIRKVLGNDILDVDGNTTIKLNRERDISIDVEQITEENIIDTYRGEFLRYFYVRNCGEYEDWADGIRGSMRQRYIHAVRKKLPLVKKGDERETLEHCSSILFDNHIWEEDIYRNMMQKYAEMGLYNPALELYQKLRDGLQTDLGTEVEPETVALAESVQEAKIQVKENLFASGEYFYGRTDLIYEIFTRIQEDSRQPKSYLFTGEAGVGKTMVMSRLRQLMDADRYLTFYWRCCESETELYLKPWYNLLAQIQEYCSDRSMADIPSTDLLFQQNTSDLQFFVTRFEVLTESVLKFLVKNFQGQKIVLFFDDIQWMDENSRRLLMNLLFCMGNRQLILIAACREDYIESLNNFKIPLAGKYLLEEVEIYRFTREETRNIIRECRPDLDTDTGAADRIYEETEGNALFLMELLQVYMEHADVNRLTRKVTNIIESRLLKLTDQERELLNVLSIFSQSVTLEELMAAAEILPETAAALLDGLLTKHLIREMTGREETRYGFNHQKIREYLYLSQSEGRRRMYHSRIAGYYEGRYLESKDLNLYSLLIYHYERCREIYKMYYYKVEYLSAFYAVHHEVYPTISDSLELNTFLDGQLGKEDKLVELAEEIRSLRPANSKTEDLKMRIDFVLGRYDLFSGDYKHGLQSIGESMELARRSQNHDYLFKNYLQMVFYGIQVSDTETMEQYISMCRELFTRMPGQREKFCMISRLYGLYLMKVDRYDEAVRVLEDTIEELKVLCEKDDSHCQGLSACYNYLGEGELLHEKWEEALEHFRKAILCSRKEYKTSGLGIFYTNAGIALYSMEEYWKAEDFIRQAIQCFETSKSLWGYAKAEAYAALLALKQGDCKSAQGHLKAARKKGRQIGNPKSLEFIHEIEEKMEAEAGKVSSSCI